MHTRIPLLAAALLTLTGTSSALAQFVTPVPAKPTPIPDYTPPAPPPPAAPTPPPPPAEPDLPPPDLITRDAEGKFVPLALPFEEAAVTAVLPAIKSDEQRERISKIMEDRRARAEQAVARNAAAAIEVRQSMAGLDSVSGAPNITAIQAKIRPMLVSPHLIDTLMAQGGLPPKEVGRARKAVEAYRKALNDDVKTAAGNDPTKMIEPLMKANLRLNWVEPSRALGDILDRLSGRWSDVRSTLGITDDQAKKIADAEKALAAASGTDAKSAALTTILGHLSGQQASTALKSVAREPADPPVDEPKKGDENGNPAANPGVGPGAGSPAKPVKPTGK